MESEEPKRRSLVKLECPFVSKRGLEMVVGEDERIDIGEIAAAFGLEPLSVKLNRHFISRGVDQVAYSVTWKSLLSCFASKGLSAPIVVHGKLSKLGTKRGRGSESTELVMKKKMKEDREGENGSALNKGYGCKRKQLVEDLSLLKRLRINESCTAKSYDGVSKNISSTYFRCGPSDQVDAIMEVPYKKIV